MCGTLLRKERLVSGLQRRMQMSRWTKSLSHWLPRHCVNIWTGAAGSFSLMLSPWQVELKMYEASSYIREVVSALRVVAALLMVSERIPGVLHSLSCTRHSQCPVWCWSPVWLFFWAWVGRWVDGVTPWRDNVPSRWWLTYMYSGAQIKPFFLPAWCSSWWMLLDNESGAAQSVNTMLSFLLNGFSTLEESFVILAQDFTFLGKCLWKVYIFVRSWAYITFDGVPALALHGRLLATLRETSETIAALK